MSNKRTNNAKKQKSNENIQRQNIEIEHLEEFSKSLKKELAKNQMIDFKMDFRTKGLYSLYKKLKRKDMSIEKVYDLAALRVIVPTIADCYRAGL